MDRLKKTTIQDIADYTDISIGTIDRVIHNRGKVSRIKKEKIEEAIRVLDFNPNLLARTLVLGKQYVICSLLPEAMTPEHYWSLPKRGVEQGAQNYRDFGIELDSRTYSLFDESSFVENAKAILERNPEGVILAPLFERESTWFIRQLEKRKIPYVFIDARISGHKNLSYIGPDVKASGYIAGKLLDPLLADGDAILIVNMVKGIGNSAHTGTIERGFRDFFKTAEGKPRRKIGAITIPSMDEREVVRELTKYYLRNPGTGGVFVTNSNAHLISKYHTDHELDIRVIGFDLVQGNIAEMKKGTIDFIISQRPIYQGTQAVRSLFDFFVNKKMPTSIQYVPLDIIIKESMDFYIRCQG